MILEIFKDFIDKSLEVYLDDWALFGCLNNHISGLRMMLNKCKEMGVSLNLEKCHFLQSFGKLLGHIVSREGMMVDPNKVKVIRDMEPQTNLLKVYTFLWHRRYYWRFFNRYVQATYPMEMLLKEETLFIWINQC